MSATVRLKRGRERPARLRHPWVFSGAVGSVEGGGAPGDVVRVADSRGGFLAWGHLSPASQIRVRLLEWDESVTVDEAWWRTRLTDSIARRSDLAHASQTNAYRLVNAEADLVPGLVVDRYADYVVIQALTAGIDRVKRLIAETLDSLLRPRGIYERSDTEYRALEHLPAELGPLRGEAPPDRVEIAESGRRFLVDVRGGQKTGFFLDQRENRRAVARYAPGREVLDCFCYTGAFSVHAAGAGASHVTAIDSSGSALDVARKNSQLNELAKGAVDFVRGNVFEVLRTYRDARRAFELIVLDPPGLAPTRVHADKALRAYKDVNLLAMKLLREGGVLATFSCSAGVDAERFREMLFWASRDAGREVQILERLGQPGDHPVRLCFPESEYLKGFLCRVL